MGNPSHVPKFFYPYLFILPLLKCSQFETLIVKFKKRNSRNNSYLSFPGIDFHKSSHIDCFFYNSLLLHNYVFGERGEHLAIQLLWVTARLLVICPIALSNQWMRETKCELNPLPGVSARIWNMED